MVMTHKVIHTIDEFNAYFRQSSTHPLVAVGDLSQADLALFLPLDFEMYCIVLMDENFGELVKGGKTMRYQPGTVFSLHHQAPRTHVGLSSGVT